jgi:Na+-driven multidrug efflux pump
VIGEQLLPFLAVSGFFITVALVYTGGLQGTGDTRSPLYITLASQIAIPIGMCTLIQMNRPLVATDIWLAIVLGHFTRAVLSILRFIGSLEHSAAAQAAYAICYTELFSMITWTSVGLMGASATIAGQNLGARHPERAIQGVHTASRIGLTVAAVVGTTFVAFPHALLGIFKANTGDVATIGAELLQFLAVSGFFITVALVYTGGLQGTGDTRSPLFITLASQIAIPIGMCTIIQMNRPLVATDIWLAIVLGHFTRAALSILRFRQGKWRHIRVEVEGATA